MHQTAYRYFLTNLNPGSFVFQSGDFRVCNNSSFTGAYQRLYDSIHRPASLKGAHGITPSYVGVAPSKHFTFLRLWEAGGGRIGARYVPRNAKLFKISGEYFQ